MYLCKQIPHHRNYIPPSLIREIKLYRFCLALVSVSFPLTVPATVSQRPPEAAVLLEAAHDVGVSPPAVEWRHYNIGPSPTADGALILKGDPIKPKFMLKRGLLKNRTKP